MSQAPVDEVAAARILVVDDDLHTRSLLKELCESLGHKVCQAADGGEALSLVGEFQPELVLLDVMMPVKDGFAVLAELRKKVETARLPVIILTAAGDLDGKIKGIELGADDYVTKPFRLFELTTRIRSALQVRRYQDRLQAVEQELEGLRRTDPITGTGGYPQLRSGLEYEVARARRYGRPLAALLACVENYDSLRGELGRAGCERLVIELVEKLKSGLRETDLLFRIDQDEFVALMPETDTVGAESARERVLLTVGGMTQTVLISVGLGVYPSAAVATPEDVMRAAQRDRESRRLR
jgi:diguanylate cyclase (GGDEF)-like protein